MYIIAGYSTLGIRVAAELKTRGADFVIISDNLRHVQLARKIGHMAYFGHLNKSPVLEFVAASFEISNLLVNHVLKNKSGTVMEVCYN
ncbi:NAD-binding protein [bacterium]|nr:NAD-binding protein [bacterium]MBU1990958.1 NAD-binding protein [bacterium]